MTRGTTLIALAFVVFACDSETEGAGGGAQTSSNQTSQGSSGATTPATTGGTGGDTQCLPSGTMCETADQETCAAMCCSGAAVPAGGFSVSSTGTVFYKCS